MAAVLRQRKTHALNALRQVVLLSTTVPQCSCGVLSRQDTGDQNVFHLRPYINAKLPAGIPMGFVRLGTPPAAI